MRRYLGSILCTILPCSIFSQQNFEGVITYETHKYGIKSVMKFFLSKTKIRFEASASLEDSTQSFNQTFGYIVDFTSGISIQYKESNQKYEIDTIRSETVEDEKELYYQKNDSSINVLDFMCNKYLFWEDSSVFQDKTKIYIWYSDDLKYIVPKIYQNKLDVPMTDDGNILKLEETQILSYTNPFDGTPKTDTIKSRAVLIEKIELPDSLFSIPKDSYSGKNPLEIFLEKISDAILQKPSKPPAKKE